MGKLTALILIVFTAVWLGPMCARLPPLETMGAAATTAPLAPQFEVAIASKTVPETPVEAAKPVPSPAVALPVAPRARPPATEPAAAAVTVSNYRTRKMFAIAAGEARISVLLTNKSDRTAVDLRLSMAVKPAGLPAENTRVNWPFTIAPSSSVYRGLPVSAAALDALLAAPAGSGSEIRWDLSYKLDGDKDKRCYVLRSLPRPRDPEGVEWRTLEQSETCPK